MAENGLGVVISNTVLVGVYWGKDGLRGIGSWGSSGGSGGNSQKSSGKSNLKLNF